MTSIKEIINNKPAVRFDYKNQAWVINGKYVSCKHPEDCDCYGKAHAGEEA